MPPDRRFFAGSRVAAALIPAALLVATLVLPGRSFAAEDPPRPAPIRLRVEPLDGSTGATVATLVETDLRAAGAFALTTDPENAVTVSGTVAGSRIDGRVLDATGTELLRTVYDSADLRRGAHEFADDIVFALTGRPGIATSRLAFVSNASGKPEIYVCEADGRERRRVTYDGGLVAHPSIDRTGSLLTYTSHRGLQPEVVVLDLLGGARRQITTSSGGSQGAALSPDGRQIALSQTDAQGPFLSLVDLDGTYRRRLTRPGWLASAPSWSPDGQRLTFACDQGDNTGPHLVEGRIGSRWRRLPLGVTTAYSPDWSPDGDRLAFVTRHHDTLWVAVWERGQARVRLLGPGQDPCWGADSRHLLFTTGDRLVTVHIETGSRRTIVENFGRLSEPTWTK